MTKGYDQRKKANQKYLATLDEIKIRVPKGEKERIRLHAEGNGESMNAFINRAIRETIERDISGYAVSFEPPTPEEVEKMRLQIANLKLLVFDKGE